MGTVGVLRRSNQGFLRHNCQIGPAKRQRGRRQASIPQKGNKMKWGKNSAAGIVHGMKARDQLNSCFWKHAFYQNWDAS